MATDDEDNYTNEEREKAAEMIEQYYEGYLSGISQATDSGYSQEQDQIAGGASDREPWPLEEWDHPEDAFEQGETLGSGKGAKPFEEEFQDKSPYYQTDE